MNVLITTSRMPFSIEAIRCFGRAGHRVFATDTFRFAPGNHSKYVEEALVVPSPRFETEAYIDRLNELVSKHEIDLLLPTFEEVFYITHHRSAFPKDLEIFAGSFEALKTLHDKSRFMDLCGRVGVRMPKSVQVKSRDELLTAIDEFGEYFARPAYSRGGVYLLTNTGPLKGAVDLEDCEPSKENPWIVQEFVHGTDVCTFSVAKEGRVTGHVTYEHARTIEHAGGISFLSVEEAETLEVTRKIVEELGYTGQMGLDFIRTDTGLVIIECNPRSTIGLALFRETGYVDAILDSRADTIVAPAGERLKIDVALLRNMVKNWHPRDWDELVADLEELLSDAPDVYAKKGDLAPLIYVILSLSHVGTYRQHIPPEHRTRSDLLASQFYDVEWDGDALH